MVVDEVWDRPGYNESERQGMQGLAYDSITGCHASLVAA
jgi:hypothetical protein